MAAKSPPKSGPIPVTIDEVLPPACQAAQVALAILSALGIPSWEQMADRYTAGEPTLIADMRRIVLTPAHRALLREHSGVALTVRANTPVVTVAVCTGCGEWEAVATGKPSKCSLTLNCGGELVSAGSVPYRFAMRPKG